MYRPQHRHINGDLVYQNLGRITTDVAPIHRIEGTWGFGD